MVAKPISPDQCTTKGQFGQCLRSARGERSRRAVAPLSKSGRRNDSIIFNWEEGHNLPKTVGILRAHLKRLKVSVEDFRDYEVGFKVVRAAARLDDSGSPTPGSEEGVGDDAGRPVLVVPILSIPRVAFVGREEERKVLTSFLLAQPLGDKRQASKLLLTGLGGMGKTALALEAAAQAVAEGHFGGGCYYVDLHGYDQGLADDIDANAVYRSAISVLAGEPPPPEASVSELRRKYHDVLNQKARSKQPVVVILDNVSSGVRIEGLLPHDELHKVIVTSRDSLYLSDSELHHQRLGPLTTTDSLKILRSVTPRLYTNSVWGEVATSESETALTGFCSGLPLALRIAGAVLESDEHLTVEDLNAELEVESNRLQALHHGDFALRAVFERSYIRLSPDLATSLRQICAGPTAEFSVGSASSLMARDQANAATTLRSLYAACLLEYGSTKGRRSVHDLLRLFVREKLDVAGGEDTEARQRLYQYFGEQIDAAIEWINGSPTSTQSPRFDGREPAIEWISAESVALSAALRTAEEDGDLESTWRLGTDLGIWFSFTGDRLQELAAASAALAAVEIVGDEGKQLDVLNNFGLALDASGKLDEARTTFAEGVNLARDRGDSGREAKLLIGLGAALRKARNFDGSLNSLQLSLNIYRDRDDPSGFAFAATNLGITYLSIENFSAAVYTLERAVELHKNAGHPRAEASTLISLALAMEASGAPPNSVQDRCAEGVAAAREMRDVTMTAQGLYALGMVLARQDRLSKAEEALIEAATKFEGLKDWERRNASLGWLLDVQQRLGADERMSRTRDRQAVVGEHLAETPPTPT